MKHAFLCTLTIASCLLAPPTQAQLQWLGPLPHAAQPAARPAARPAAAPPHAARRQTDDDDDILHSPHYGFPFELVIKDNQAKVCQLAADMTRVCAAIEAPLPTGFTIQLWNLPNGTTAVSYARTPGVEGTPDPDGTATRHFQAAFNGAARAVLTRVRNTTSAPAVEVVCDNEDCDNSGEGGGGGGGGGGPDGGSGGGSGSGDPPVPVVTVHGTPDPDTKIPTVVITGQREQSSTIELLPPPDPRDPLARLTDACINSPILRVCIIGKRPPVLVDEPPLPTGNPPWFSQWACNFAHVFCTRGQIRRTDDPGPEDPPIDPSWPKKPQFLQCKLKVDIHHEYCVVMERVVTHEQTVHCIETMFEMAKDCQLLYGPGK